MNAKHTPGPWKASQGTETEPERWTVVAENGPPWWIAVLENGQPGDCLETEAATARLIAAAPEMLAALRHVTRLLGMWKEDPECTCEDCVMLRPVYAAITKALGPDWQNSVLSHLPAAYSPDGPET